MFVVRLDPPLPDVKQSSNFLFIRKAFLPTGGYALYAVALAVIIFESLAWLIYRLNSTRYRHDLPSENTALLDTEISVQSANDPSSLNKSTFTGIDQANSGRFNLLNFNIRLFALNSLVRNFRCVFFFFF